MSQKRDVHSLSVYPRVKHDFPTCKPYLDSRVLMILIHDVDDSRQKTTALGCRLLDVKKVLAYGNPEHRPDRSA
eukprot:scaffold9463_cov140-Skeletonema_menzelii.AAC.2